MPAVVALLFLNAALSFSTWWPTPGIVLDARIAPEFVGLWVVLLVVVAWRGQVSRRAALWLAAAYLLLVVGRYVDVTVPSLFGRPVNLFWDLPQIPRFLWVSLRELPPYVSVALVAAVVLLLSVLYALLARAIALAGQHAAPYALRSRWVLGLTLVGVAVAAANYAGVRATWGFVSKPVVPVYLRQARVLTEAWWARVGVQAAELASSRMDAAMASPQRALSALRGRDVYVVFLESYGAVQFDNPRMDERLRPLRQRFAGDLAAGGWQVASAFVRSPTFAGGSDLAHLGLLSGLDLSDPFRHDVLLTTQRPTLISLFKAAGYRTFGLYPAVRWEWPERRYYGFDEYLEARTLGYRGPRLGYWWLPDQFSMARLDELHPRDASAPPRFVFFPTITTHLPFSPVPPFQPDWQRVLSDTPYDADDVARALSEKANWTDMFDDYLRMFDYAYRWLGAWLQRSEPREAVYLLIGDHQPAANVSGEGATWDVPAHLVTRDAALLQRFVDMGFSRGVEPARAPLGAMHELTAMMLRAFGDDAASPKPLRSDADVPDAPLRGMR